MNNPNSYRLALPECFKFNFRLQGIPSLTIYEVNGTLAPPTQDPDSEFPEWESADITTSGKTFRFRMFNLLYNTATWKLTFDVEVIGGGSTVASLPMLQSGSIGDHRNYAAGAVGVPWNDFDSAFWGGTEIRGSTSWIPAPWVEWPT